MFLAQIDIANFRGIRYLSLTLDDTTVLIGENNTGKSTILAALEACLSRSLNNRRGGPFLEYDYHLAEQDSQPVDSDGIEITLYFAERQEGEWAAEIAQSLANTVQIGDDGKLRLVFRVRSRYDSTQEDFSTDWDFLDLAGNELPLARGYVNTLQQLSPVFLFVSAT